MKKNYNYLIILLYGITLICLFTGLNNVYGSSTDWINQHSVFPEYFRKTFYETGNLVPNFAFNIGGGQNIFNFSYYGLMSPIILISYLLPFISMPIYIIIASIFLYLISGILIYKFLETHNYNSKICLYSSLVFLSLAPITFHFHHHIMFVWYIPFLVSALFGVDKFINNNKSLLLMLSIFLIILTNYYYSISCIFLIVLYGIYSLIKNYKNTNDFLLKLFKAVIAIIIPILMSCFILIPTLFSIINSERATNVKVTLQNLFIFNLDEVSYLGFSIGLTFIFLLIPFMILSKKKIKKDDLFLSIALLVITYIPIIMYALNGMLYVRGKVLIPFTIIYVITLAKCLNEFKEINTKKLTIYGLILLLFIIITNFHSKLILILLLDSLITAITLYNFKKYNKKEIIYIPLLIILIITAFVNNYSENYVSRNHLKSILDNSKSNILTNIKDKNYYRVDDYTDPNLNSNRIYNNNFNNTSIYSSNYNHYYRKFYNKYNNIAHRNNLIQAGSRNILTNYLMDVKYVISDNDVGYGYHKIKHNKKIDLYENDLVNDLIYTTPNIGSYNDLKKLSFPYNMEYMINFPVVDSKKNVNYQSKIKELPAKDNYSFTLDEDKTYKYKINSHSKILIITFYMDYNEVCPNDDQSITINNVKNKLTCDGWIYHNQNRLFKYVISNNNDINNLNIEISKGKYKISNVKVYTYEMPVINKNKVNNLKINKKDSIITGNININDKEYAITSLPYDDSFKVYIDNKLVKSKIVNEDFLGFTVNKGNHEIKIKYSSKGYLIGLLISLFGFLSFVAMLVYEKYQNKINKLLKKYKEIILYLIFGVMTTIISLAVYFLLTKTILDSNNSIELQIANIISWIASVLFAYITNSKYVFDGKITFKEMIKFYSSRLSTLFIDMAIMFIFVSLLHFNNDIIKIIDQFAVIVINYILSKFLVFKGGK